MVVRYDNNINDWDIGNLTRQFRETFWAEPAHGGATIGEDRVEEGSQPRGKLYKKASMPKPGGSQSGNAPSIGGEGRPYDGNLKRQRNQYNAIEDHLPASM